MYRARRALYTFSSRIEGGSITALTRCNSAYLLLEEEGIIVAPRAILVPPAVARG